MSKRPIRHTCGDSTGLHHAGHHSTVVREAFDRLADGWDERHGWQSPQAEAVRRRVEYLRAVCRARDRPRVLDVGCGTGLYLLAISDLVSEGIGLDLSPKMIDRAEHSRHRQDNSTCAPVRFSVGAAESLDARWGRFDLVIFGGSLEHMRDPSQVLGRLPPVLKRRGEVVAILRDPRNPATALRRWLRVKDETPWHRHIGPAEFQRLAETAGLRCIWMQPLDAGKAWWSMGAIWPPKTYAAHLAL